MGIADELIRSLRAECGGRFDDTYFDDVYINDYPGCVPDDRLSDDVMTDIIDKVRTYVAPVVKMLESRYKTDIRVVVEPSYEADTDIVIYDFKTKKVLYTNSLKAWHLQGMSVGDIASDLLSIYDEAALSLVIRKESKKKSV